MTSITITTIVVVALLTGIVFGLAWLAYSSCLKVYKLEVDQGKHDNEIFKKYHSKNKSKLGLVGTVCSYLALTILAGLFVVGIVYKARGENLSINNQTVLVIKSDSMSGYYDEELNKEYKSLEYKDLQFDIGDICVFEKTSDDTELVKGEVYGYKYKGVIITHRLIEIEEGLYKFRGDNNVIADPYYVERSNIVYHYTGQKVPAIGAFILYAQSYFGIWSIVGIIGVAVVSEIINRKINKINKDRDKLIYTPEEKNIEKGLLIEEKAVFVDTVKEIWPQLNEEPTAEAPSETQKEEEEATNEE